MLESELLLTLPPRVKRILRSLFFLSFFFSPPVSTYSAHLLQKERYISFVRIFSGTLKKGDKIQVLSREYDPVSDSNEEFIKEVFIFFLDQNTNVILINQLFRSKLRSSFC